MRKSLIKLARRIEESWQHVNFEQSPLPVSAGWYVTEFVVEGVLATTPRILVRLSDGKTAERELTGAHSGRNRMLVYLPQGTLRAHSQSIEFLLLARVPGWEGRARVLLICWRYLLDFFSPWTLVRMVAMQFKNPFSLSTQLLEFYTPPETTILATFEWWQRRAWWARWVAWHLRGIRVGVIVERSQQHDLLINMLCPPDAILSLADTVISAQDLKSCDYWVPLAHTEEIRNPGILLIKLAIWRARRGGLSPLLLYADHDYAANGSSPQFPEPVFKPNASQAYLHCFNYLGPAVVFARELLDGTGGDKLLDPEWQYQTALAVFSKTERVRHLPELLFTSYRTEVPATPAPTSPQSPWPDIVWQRESTYNRLRADENWLAEPSVDIVIPTRDGLQFLQPCVDGILNKTSYQNLQLFIVDNGSELNETREWLREIEKNPRVSVLDYPGEFNFSAINNAAVAAGSGDYVALVNNDIEVIHADWLRQMMVWAKQENVGIVGSKLLFSNGLVQHAGVTIGMGNAAGHIHRLEAGDAPGYQHRCLATQNMMAVTAACFITPRRLYEQLGGLNETEFKVAYNDIDYCLRVEKMGLDVIWTPEARLYHHESVSRGDDMSERHIERYFKELAALQKRWKTRGFVDKYYNKHLRISDEGVYPQIDVAGQDALREF